MAEIPESDREADLPHPRETAVFYGHDVAVRTLARAISTGQLPTAFLIGGPRGVGKATLAYRASRVLLRGTPIDPEGPDPLAVATDAPVFRQIARLAHPDLLVLRRPWDERAKRFKTQLPVEDVRRVHGFFSHHAGAGGWRVCILDAADDLNLNAANALLKALEEPPRRAVFFIVAHAPARLLATIRSRCRRLMLQPLTETDVAKVLAAEAPEVSADERGALARLAEGSPGRALALAASGGLDLYRELSALLAALPNPEAGAVHGLAERLAKPEAEQEYRVAVELLRGFLSRLVRAGGTGTVTAVQSEEQSLIVRLAADVSLERWVEVWEKTGQLVARTDALNLDRRQVVLSVFTALKQAASGAAVMP